jgi:hypothetical protein
MHCLRNIVVSRLGPAPIAALALALFARSGALASNYPTDYPFHWVSSTGAGPSSEVTFERTVQVSRDLVLTIRYGGRLAHKVSYDPNLAGKLRVWVRLNGVDVVLPVSVQMVDPRTPMGTAWAATGPYDCRSTTNSINRSCRTPDESLARLFTFARQPERSWAQNAWDIEAAFFIEGTDEWDSLDGANYRYRFEPFDGP